MSVLLAGSRVVPSGLRPWLTGWLPSVGSPLLVGCCVGFDAAVLSAVSTGAIPVSSVSCFAAFGSRGAGSCSLSASSAVFDFALLGGTVQWWAGGGSPVPLRARLARRSAALVEAASSVVVFAGSSFPSCTGGSYLVASTAAARRLPVVVFPLGFCSSLLPSLGGLGGSWQTGTWDGSFSWLPVPGLFG